MSRNDTAGLTVVRTGPRQMLPLVVGALALTAVAVLALIVFSGGSPDAPEPMPLSTPVAEADGDDTSATADDAVEPASIPVITYEVFLARDPFEPVVPEDIERANAAGDAPTGSDDPTTPTDPTSPTTPTTPTNPDDPDAPACVGSVELVCDGRVVSLLDIITVNGERAAVIQVDTMVYEVVRGQIFASNFELRAIDGSCISLLYGDDGFQLCRGDTILK